METEDAKRRAVAVAAAYQENGNLREVAEKFGCSHERVRQILRMGVERGWVKDSARNMLDDELRRKYPRRKLAELFAKHLYMLAVSRATKIPLFRLNRLVEESGIDVKALRGEAVRKKLCADVCAYFKRRGIPMSEATSYQLQGTKDGYALYRRLQLYYRDRGGFKAFRKECGLPACPSCGQRKRGFSADRIVSHLKQGERITVRQAAKRYHLNNFLAYHHLQALVAKGKLKREEVGRGFSYRLV